MASSRDNLQSFSSQPPPELVGLCRRLAHMTVFVASVTVDFTEMLTTIQQRVVIGGGKRGFEPEVYVYAYIYLRRFAEVRPIIPFTARRIILVAVHLAAMFWNRRAPRASRYGNMCGLTNREVVSVENQLLEALHYRLATSPKGFEATRALLCTTGLEHRCCICTADQKISQDPQLAKSKESTLAQEPVARVWIQEKRKGGATPGIGVQKSRRVAEDEGVRFVDGDDEFLEKPRAEARSRNSDWVEASSLDIPRSFSSRPPPEHVGLCKRLAHMIAFVDDCSASAAMDFTQMLTAIQQRVVIGGGKRGFEPEVYVYAYIYLRRFANVQPIVPSTAGRIILIAVYLAVKFWDRRAPKASQYSNVCGLTKQEVVSVENQLLEVLHYRLAASPECFEADRAMLCRTGLEHRCATCTDDQRISKSAMPRQRTLTQQAVPRVWIRGKRNGGASHSIEFQKNRCLGEHEGVRFVYGRA